MNEIKIQVPEGFDGIDEEKSDLSNGIIVFKEKKQVPWRHRDPRVLGYWINNYSEVKCENAPCSWSLYNKNIFATEKQAKSMLAMAQLSQIIQNDERFGGVVTDEEWENEFKAKHIISRSKNRIKCYTVTYDHDFLAFHTREQRDLFLQENKDLIKQYFMLD